MEKNIAYIPGLFEGQDNPLLRYLKEHILSDIEFHSIAPFPKDKFGTQSFHQTIRQMQNFIDTTKPETIVAHSLGAYVAMLVSTYQPLILLDPSLAISDIIAHNTIKYGNVSFYDDGRCRIKLSREFLESIKTTPSIEELTSNAKTRDVCIFGAGKGGHKIAERYHRHTPHSHYVFLPDATHEFKNKSDRRQILVARKKRLDIMPSREEGGHTRFL